MDLALNNPQWLIYHKTKPKQIKIIAAIEYVYKCLLNVDDFVGHKKFMPKPKLSSYL